MGIIVDPEAASSASLDDAPPKTKKTVSSKRTLNSQKESPEDADFKRSLLIYTIIGCLLSVLVVFGGYGVAYYRASVIARRTEQQNLIAYERHLKNKMGQEVDLEKKRKEAARLNADMKKLYDGVLVARIKQAQAKAAEKKAREERRELEKKQKAAEQGATKTVGKRACRGQKARGRGPKGSPTKGRRN